MKNHKTSSFENSFLSVLDSNKPVHGMFKFVISNVKDGHISPLRSFYWLQTINTCSTIDNCSANTVPSVFLLHTNRWSATINDIGVRSQEVIELTQTFWKVKRIRRNFYTCGVTKIWFSTHFNIGFMFANLKKKIGSVEGHHDYTEELNNWSSDR